MTPLTYYGGKQMLARQIVALMPSHRVYLEPFAGGAAVLFAKARAERETINDLDSRVMRFWRVVRERADELAEAIERTPYSREEWYASRAPCEDDLECARRLLVEVDQSFSRSRSSWSVPCIGNGRGRWQPGTWGNLPPKIAAAAERLSGVALEQGDALTMIPRWDRADAVIYCDPPYAGPLRTDKSKGYREDDPEVFERLVDVLLEVRHAAVILSGYPCEAATRLGWRAVGLDRKRTVQSRSGEVLRAAPEVVWLSPQLSGPAASRLWDVDTCGARMAAETTQEEA
jgi:DNA adenine methylase